MDYFKDYGLSEEDINELEEYLSMDDINNYYVGRTERRRGGRSRPPSR